MSAQTEGWHFGSKKWQEYYHGRNKNGHRAATDRAQRVRASYKRAATKAGERAELQRRADEAEAEAQALAQWEAEVERLALEAQAEQASHQMPAWRPPSPQALTVQVRAQILPESAIVAMISAGWRWSQRRGGMWWANRSPEAERLARAICA